MRFVILALFVAAVSAAPAAPLYKAKSGDVVPNSYLIKLKSGTDMQSFVKTVESVGVFVTRRYTNVFNGIAINALGKDINALRSLPGVEYIQEDMIVRASVEWGCDRIDQRNLPLDGAMDIYADGAGAHVYITDTGLRHSHQEYASRADYFWDFDPDNEGDDCNGHGTHCGGTAVGNYLNGGVGIARAASVYSVRVLNCAGAGLTNNIVAGLDAIAAGGNHPGVCSMSLGGGASPALDSATRDLIAAGFPTSVAAGNDNADACNTSPARVAEAETVGSTTDTDARSGFSNYGTCLDLFAPGSSVYSSYNGGDADYRSLSGTSMACPHVTGAIAVHLGSGQCSTGANCKSKLRNDATSGVVGNPGAGSPNLLLFVE